MRLTIIFIIQVVLANYSFSQQLDANLLYYSCDIKTGHCSGIAKSKDSKTINKKKMSEKKKAKLVYYYDALCGWCFGFSPVIAKIKSAYKDNVEIEVVSGGLFLGNRAGLVNDVAPHIKAGAYKSVEAATGVKFGETFLKDVFGAGKMTLNSIWPAIALCIVKDKKPESQVTFAKILLDAIYYEGIDTIDINAIAECSTQIGFDAEDFKVFMEDPIYKEKANNEFENYKINGIRGMPSLLLKTEGKQVLLSNGYINYKDLAKRIDTYLN